MTKKSYKTFAARSLIAQRPTVPVPVVILGVPQEDLVNENLFVVSQHDEAYRQAESSFWADVAALQLQGLKDKERTQAIEMLRCRQVAALVVSWTFEEECNIDNVAEFLYENPNMFNAINTMCARDELFFAGRANSLPTE